MVADELALDLAAEHISPSTSLLDPFCGSGRLLAAADMASLRVGVDANPLACLLTRAKLAPASAGIVAEVLHQLPMAKKIRPIRSLTAFTNGKVEWFSSSVIRDLERVLTWLNGMQLAAPELSVVAAALSATVREVSFARQSGWKLHRLAASDRAGFDVSVFDRLERRLRYCEGELAQSNIGDAESEVHLADARSLVDGLARPRRRLFDVIMTSPPYGDSRTTVQYGAASALCLSVVSRLKGLEHLGMTGGRIDATCLGGQYDRSLRESYDSESLKPYWAGSPDSPSYRALSVFLYDYRKVCRDIAGLLKPGGKAILVVGRRSTGSFRLKLDDFTADELEKNGLTLMDRYHRVLHQKRFPRVINRFGRSTDEAERRRGRLTTMRNETILVLQKPANPSTRSKGIGR